MNTRCLLYLATFLVPSIAFGDLWVTNFSSPSVGVWRNSTTSTDLTIPVGFTQTGATIDGGTTLDNSFSWQTGIFNPTYYGDYIALLVKAATTVPVTITFSAEIVNPILNFTDVDAQTTLVFSTADPTKVSSLANLSVIGDSVTTAGFSVKPFDPTDLETAGSLQFTGTFTELSFQIVNVGPDPDTHDDVTGFSVSTTVEPVAAGPPPALTIWTTRTHFHLSWPSTSSFTELEYSTSFLGPWMLLPGASPTTTTTWSAPFTSFGDTVFIRGVF